MLTWAGPFLQEDTGDQLGAHRGESPWPKRLRIHKIGEVYSLTWSFASPDGRALFTISPDTDGEPLLAWLAIGYHDIYQ